MIKTRSIKLLDVMLYFDFKLNWISSNTDEGNNWIFFTIVSKNIKNIIELEFILWDFWYAELVNIFNE